MIFKTSTSNLSKKEEILMALDISSINLGGSGGPNAWISSSEKQIISYNPANQEAISTVQLCNQQDCQQIISQAHNSFLSWRQVPAPKRGELIRQIGLELRHYKEILGNLIALEMGKSKQEADGEVQEMIDMADFAVGQSRMLYGKTMHSERAMHRMYEQWHPLGVVGVITAFNFPVAVWAWNAFIAAICGNTIIWKPSSKTPLCAIAIQHICNRVMAENNQTGIFCLLLPENHQVAENFVEDHRVPLVSFTGSSHAGKQINKLVSKRLGRCLLEMSGNNAVIIDETADLQLAIPAILFGAIGTAGQRCTSIRRLIIHKTQYQKVIGTLIKAYQRIKIGDPLDIKNLMGPLIDQSAVQNFTTAIAAALQMGGEVLFGGKALTGAGYFVEPTIIRAENHWHLVQQETFAPILYVMTYDHFSQAVEINNSVPQGLSSALFTNNLRHSEYFLSAQGSDCGIANINIGTSGAEIGGAFGGEKETGGGREAGSDAWKNYMRRQTNTINWGSDLPLAQSIEFDFKIL